MKVDRKHLPQLIEDAFTGEDTSDEAYFWLCLWAVGQYGGNEIDPKAFDPMAN